MTCLSTESSSSTGIEHCILSRRMESNHRHPAYDAGVLAAELRLDSGASLGIRTRITRCLRPVRLPISSGRQKVVLTPGIEPGCLHFLGAEVCQFPSDRPGSRDGTRTRKTMFQRRIRIQVSSPGFNHWRPRRVSIPLPPT